MRTNLVRGVVSAAVGLTLAISSAWAAELTSNSTMGELIDNPAAKAVLEKHVPGMADNPQMEQARGMSLRGLQAFVPTLTDDVLAAIDKDLAEATHEH